MLKLHECDKISYPIVTEKSTIQKSENKYHFMVHPEISKISIKTTIESLFEVKVKKVCVMNVKGKVKTKAGRLAKLKDSKKAIVTLDEGHSINFEQ